MFYTIFGDFPKDLLYFGFNSGEQQSMFWHIFEFHEHSKCQTAPIFLDHNFFTKIHWTRGSGQHGTSRGRNERASRDQDF
jgi:hypothetical protein